MKFGCCISRAEDISALISLGCDFYEYSGAQLAAMSEAEFDRFADLSGKLGLPCRGLNNYCSGLPAIVGDAFSREAASAYAHLLSSRGHRLGICALGIGAPAARRLPGGYSAEKADKQCVAFLRATAEAAAENGQLVLFEAVHAGLCDYAVHTADAVRVVEQTGLSNVGIVLDFYHMRAMKEDFSSVKAALPYIHHVHISTSLPNLQRGFPKECDAEEYREIFAWLKSHGYNGSVSIEPSGFNFNDARSSFEMLRRLDRDTEEL